MTEDDVRKELHHEANRILIDAEYTGRQHMLCARRWRRWVAWTGLPREIAATVASGGAGLSAVIGGAVWITAGLALVGLIANAIHLVFQPEQQVVGHDTKGTAYVALRNEARRFMNIDLYSLQSLDSLSDRVRTLGGRCDDLRSQEPTGLPEWTYKKVKTAIAAGDYSYDNDPLWFKYRKNEP